MASVTITPDDRAVLQSLQIAARDLIHSLARTGSGNYNPVVERYQKSWNGAQATIDKVPSVAFKKLATDGKYGKNTASTLYHVLSGVTPPPARAYEMPTWYAQNRSAVDSIGSFAPAPTTIATAPAAVAPTGPITPTVPVPVQQPQLQPPVPTVTAQVPPAPGRSAEVVSVTAEVVEPADVPGVVVRNGVPAVTVASGPSSAQTLPELKVYGKTPKGDVVFYALAATGVALAGLIGWRMMRRA